MTSDDDQDPESALAPQKREERQADADAYGDLADLLARGKFKNLPAPPFEGQLLQAVRDAQRFVKGARARQIRRLAQLLRVGIELDELRNVLSGNTPAARAKAAQERIIESWRTRLLSEGDAALSALISEFPQADRTQLRQLLRQASKAPDDQRSKKASTELLRAVRALHEVSAQAETD